MPALAICWRRVSSLKEHRHRPRILLERLSARGNNISTTKSEFGVPAFDCPGDRLGATGIRSLANKVQVILDFPAPTLVTKPRQFLVLINYTPVLSGTAPLYLRLYTACTTKLDWNASLDFPA